MTTDRYDQKLVPIDNIKQYLDKKQTVKSNLYNHQGMLVLPRGKKLKKISNLPPLYIYKKITRDSINIKDTASPEKTTINEAAVDRLSKAFGLKTVERYKTSIEKVEKILSRDLQPDDLNTIKDIMNDTPQEEVISLSGCIQNIRQADTYTMHHSLAVGLRLGSALRHFKKYNNENWFFDIFKNKYESISFAEESIKTYALGGILHDFGKTAINKKILLKPGPLNRQEFTAMKQHPRLGVEHLKKININNSKILDIVGNHHAAYLTSPGSRQSSLAVLCNIIDIHDACRSQRCYKKPFSPAKTIEIITKESQRFNWPKPIVRITVKEILPRFEKSFLKAG